MRADPCDTEGGGQGVPVGLWRSVDANVPKGSVLGIMGISILTLAAAATSLPVFVSECLLSGLLLSDFFGGAEVVEEERVEVEELEEVEEVEEAETLVVELEEGKEDLPMLLLPPLLVATLPMLALAALLGVSTVSSSFTSSGSFLICGL